MIAAGVTTFNRAQHLKLFKKQFEKNSPGIELFIEDDNVEKKGVAFRKNQLIKRMYDAGAEHFFLFDDDCFPIKKGWEKFVIEAGEKHILYMVESLNFHVISRHFNIAVMDNCAGCFMYFTREVVESVGFFNTEYFYGFEHADYSNRIHRAGISRYGQYQTIAGLDEYIYSLDLNNSRDFDIDHYPSLPVKDALAHIRVSQKIYIKNTPVFIPIVKKHD